MTAKILERASFLLNLYMATFVTDFTSPALQLSEAESVDLILSESEIISKASKCWENAEKLINFRELFRYDTKIIFKKKGKILIRSWEYEIVLTDPQK